MKALVITLSVLVSSLAMAQHHSSISRSINDTGKTLSIRINGTVDGKLIDYDRTFDVADLSKEERNALRERILDSLHVNMPEPPKPLRPSAALRTPRTPLVPSSPLTPSSKRHTESTVIMDNDRPTVLVNQSDNQAVTMGGKQPYTKVVNYNADSGRLFLRYCFKKDGDDVTYERTLDAPNKSQQERQRMIEGFEKEIGLPTTGK